MIAATTDTADGLRAAAERIVRAHELQGDMPGPAPPPPAWWQYFIEMLRHFFHALGRAGAWLLHLLGKFPPFHWLGGLLAWLWSLFAQIGSPVLQVVLALLILAIVCGLVYWLVDVVARWRRTWREIVPAGAVEVTVAADAVLDDADALARQGRYAEAVHALLLHGLAHVRRNWPQAIADSLTSREIVRTVALPAAARNALDDLVIRAELGHFGLYPVVAQDYAACRGLFAALTAAIAEPRLDGAAP